MADPKSLEQELAGAIDAAADEAALEVVRSRRSARGLGLALLKTLGSMTPEERKTNGPLINGLRDRVNAAIRSASASSTTPRSTPGSRPRGSTSRCRCARRRPRPAASIRSARWSTN